MRTLERRLAALFLATFAALSAFAQLPDTLNDVELAGAELSGANIRPNPGDPIATGYAKLVVLRDYHLVGYRISTANTDFETAHVHRANGEIVVDLHPAVESDQTDRIANGWAAIDPVVNNELHANPSSFYVDIHSTNAETARGQLQPLRLSSSVVPAAPMTGANVPGGDPDGTGIAIFSTFNLASTLHYMITTEGVSNPTAAHIHYGAPGKTGAIAIDLKATFSNGAASGAVAVDPMLATDIHREPGAFYVDVHSSDFPGGAIRAQIARPINPSSVFIPGVGRAAGANGTFFRTDLSIVNQSASPNLIFIQYFPSGESPNPVRIISRLLAPNEQHSFNGDELQTALGVGDGTGALRIEASLPISAVARVYNDQRAQGKGTFGQFVHAATSNQRRLTGMLPMLSNQQGNTGYRSNLGWFNSGTLASTVTFELHGANGAVLQTVSRNVPGGQQLQMGLTQLFQNVTAADSLYVTFSATTPLHVYASVVDNTNGDAVFIPAQAR